MKGINLFLLLTLIACATEKSRPKTVRESLDTKERQFRQCFAESDSYLSKKSPLKGRVKLIFNIASDGSVMDEKIEYSDYKDPNMHACMLSQLREIEFSPPSQAEDGGIIKASKELFFERRKVSYDENF